MLTKLRASLQLDDSSITTSKLLDGSITLAKLSPALQQNITLQGNAFNGINQLVKLDGTGKLPAIDGSQLTGISGSGAFTLAAGGAILVTNTGATIGQVLTISGAGAANWQTPSGGGGSPAGATGAMQFNNAGAFGGNAAKLFWDVTNFRLGIGNNAPAYPLDVTGYARATSLLAGDFVSGGGFPLWARTASGFNVAITFDGTGSGASLLKGVDNGNGFYAALTIGGAPLCLNAGNALGNFVGIGTLAPTALLHVAGSVRVVDGTQAAGKVFTSDALGNATWQTPTGGGGTPAGATGAVQFNNAGAFGGDAAKLFWNEASGFLGIGTNTPAYPLDIVVTTGVPGPIASISNSSANGAGLLVMANSTVITAVCNANQTAVAAAANANSSTAYGGGVAGNHAYSNSRAMDLFNQGSTSSVPMVSFQDNSTAMSGDMLFINANVSGLGTFTGNLLNLQVAGSSKLVVDGGGNLGIGTATPLVALEVDAAAKINGNSGVSSTPALSVTAPIVNQDGIVSFASGTGVSGTGGFIGVSGESSGMVAVQAYSHGNGTYALRVFCNAPNPTVPLIEMEDFGARTGDALHYNNVGSLAGNLLNLQIAGVTKFSIGASGAVKIADGTQAVGRVLTSDGAGNASWQNVPAVGGPQFADLETPAGAVDGVNAVFTLATSPTPAGSLHLYLNGLLQRAGGNDYTLAGATITFTTAPTLNSVILASYRF